MQYYWHALPGSSVFWNECNISKEINLNIADVPGFAKTVQG